MGMYAATVSKAGLAAAGNMFVLWSPSQTLTVKQIAISIPASSGSVAPDLYVVRCSARGTQTATQVGQAYDPNDNAATGTLDNTWSAAATVGAIGTALSRLSVPAAAGAGWVDAVETLDAYIVRSGAGLAIVNNSATQTGITFNVTVRWRE